MIPEFNFCIEVIQKVYTFYPQLPKTFDTFKTIIHSFLFLSHYTPDYTLQTPELNIYIRLCKQELLHFDTDCYHYFAHLYMAYTHFPQKLELYIKQQSPLGTPIDYNFQTDEHNKITHIVFTLLYSISQLKQSTLFTKEDILFLRALTIPKIDLESQPKKENIILDSKLHDLYRSMDYFMLPEASALLSECWLHLITQPFTLRLYLLYCVK